MSVRRLRVIINRAHRLHPRQRRICCHGGHHRGAGGSRLQAGVVHRNALTAGWDWQGRGDCERVI